jgi:hypothetical protein
MLLTLALVFGVVALPSSAGATFDLVEFEAAVDAMLAVDPTLDPPPDDGKRDFVVAGFQLFGNSSNWGVSAHSGPLGEEPFGHVSVTFDASGEDKHGRFRVTCLDVDVIQAVARVVPTQAASNDTGIGSSPHMFFFLDGGPGGTLDQFSRAPHFLPLLDCHNPFWDFLLLGASQPIDRGNILVHDALP